MTKLPDHDEIQVNMTKLKVIQDRELREKFIKENPALMDYEYEQLYLTTGDEEILNEFKKLNSLKRVKPYFAINEHPDNYLKSTNTMNFYRLPFSDDEVDDKDNYWLDKYFTLNESIVSSGYSEFKTLSLSQIKELNDFCLLYSETERRKDRALDS